MASFYRKATSRHLPKSAGRSEGNINWSVANHDGQSRERWGNASQDELSAALPSRGRSQTMNSSMSFYAASNSDSSAVLSRSTSPHLTRDKAILGSESKENAAKAWLSKGGRILRRHGSKFSLSSFHTIDSDTSDRYPSRPSTAHPKSGSKANPAAVDALRRDELKRTISDPFDFQHVTHTDQRFLNSIQRVPKTELVGEFSALRAGQASKPQLRGIRADDLPTNKSLNSHPASPEMHSEVDTESAGRDAPHGPAPPPKDQANPFSTFSHVRLSRSVDNFSRPLSSSTMSGVTPPRRYSSRRALQPNLASPVRPLGAYTHTPSHSLDISGTESPEDICANCRGMEVVCDKPLPCLPQVHAVTTDDSIAMPVRVATLPRTPLDLADVPEEDEFKRQSMLMLKPSQEDTGVTVNENYRSDMSSPTSSVKNENILTESPANRTFVVDDWDDAIDDSWDQAADANVAQLPSPHSMTDQVTSFVDKAMTRFVGPEHSDCSGENKESPLTNSPQSQSNDHSDQPQEQKLFAAEATAPKHSELSPLLGLGIDGLPACDEGSDASATPTAVVTSPASPRIDRDSAMTASFNSDYSTVSCISKSSSQESIIWSIASSIMGTQRSSNSSSSFLEQLPDYPRPAKSIDDLKEALESVQEHLQEIHEDQLTLDCSNKPSTSSGKQAHQRAQSLATDFVFGESNAPAHGRLSNLPIPTRKSSAQPQPGFSRPTARRMRSATTVARSRQSSRTSSRASYSLFPEASPTSF